MFKKRMDNDAADLEEMQGLSDAEEIVADEDAQNIEDIEDFEDGGSELDDAMKKPKKKLPGWVIIPILAVVVAAAFLIPKLFNQSDKAAALEVVTVDRDDVKSVYNGSGKVESERTKVFYSPVNAPILTCAAKVGESIKANDMLVTFDVTNLERDNQQSELNALSAKYSNQDAVEQSNRAAQSAAQAEGQKAASISNLQSQIQDKENQIANMKASADQAANEAAANAAKAGEIQGKMQDNQNKQSDQKALKENLDRQLAGMTPDTDPDSEYNKTLQQASEATDALSKLEQEYRKYEQELSAVGATDASGAAAQITALQQEVDSLKASLSELENSGSATTDTGLTGGQLNNMQVSENLAELSKLTTEELVAKAKEGIKAEFDGIISDVKATEGSAAVQGGELFTLVSNKDVIVKMEVSANDFDDLTVGNKATVKIGKSEYNGTLKSIDKIALTNEKGNPVIGAKVHIDNPDDNIFVGVNAKVAMTVAEKKNVLCLPNEVVNTSTDGDFVYIIKNGTVKKQMVDLGVASSSKVEITGGLKKGDKVVSDTSGDITEGMKATAVQAPTGSVSKKE